MNIVEPLVYTHSSSGDQEVVLSTHRSFLLSQSDKNKQVQR